MEGQIYGGMPACMAGLDVKNLNRTIPIMKQPMEKALQVAQKNLKEIRTVTEWAERMGYDCSKHFLRKPLTTKTLVSISQIILLSFAK